MECLLDRKSIKVYAIKGKKKDEKIFILEQIMGIGILIVVIGSLIYKGRNRIQKIFDKYRNKSLKKGQDFYIELE